MRNFILFDLDGTLIDGVDDLVHAMNEVLSARNLRAITRPELEPMLGDGMRMLTTRAFSARGRELGENELDEAYADYVRAYKATDYRYTRLFAGVATTLRALHEADWQIGLASNKLSEPCNAILEKLGVRELFRVVAGGDAVEAKKPDPGHLRHALAAMGYRAGEDRAVMVGDHANDVNAARGAGLEAVAVALEVSDARARSLGADAVLNDFSALPAALAAMGSKLMRK